MVPKLLFQTYASAEELDTTLRNNIAELKKRNPDWNYVFFDNKKMDNYVRNFLPAEYVKILSRVNKNYYGIIVANIFKYCLVYKFGGVYLDSKSTCLESLNDSIPTDTTFLLSRWRNKPDEEFHGWGLHKELGNLVDGGEFQQWFLVAKPQHPFLRATIVNAFRNLQNYSVRQFGVGKAGVLRLTGPICYTRSIVPLMQNTPYNLVDIYSLGFRYSVYEHAKQHMSKENHYSRQTEPIVLND